jgi:hypothetical protein
MDNSPYVKFHADQRLFTWHPQGVLDSDTVSKVVAFIEIEEQESIEPFNRFTDLSRLAAIELDFEYIVQVSMHRRKAYADNEPAKSAFLTSTPQASRLASLHATLMDQSPLRVAFFSEIDAAADWLNVPCELLLP